MHFFIHLFITNVQLMSLYYDLNAFVCLVFYFYFIFTSSIC